MSKRKLGRGLGALLGRPTQTPLPTDKILRVPVGNIQPNPWQPRTDFSIESLQGLIDSIRSNGVLQPIVLRAADSGYQIVAGERRWRAAIEAGLADMPAVVRDVDDRNMLLLALLENVVREDLNPIERARGYAQLLETLSCTQEELAQHLSEARATLANTIRLLELPEEIQDLVSRGTISAGHGRALLGVKDPKLRDTLCKRILRNNLSVRQTEDMVREIRSPSTGKSPGKSTAPHIRELQERLERSLGAKVIIKERKKGGRITIDFKSHDDFDRILSIIEQSSPVLDGTTDFHV